MSIDYTQWRSMVDEQAYPAIPDSGLLHDWDPSESSDGDLLVDTVNDENMDSVGSPTLVSDGINGLPVMEYDGTNDGHLNDDHPKTIAPLVTFHVVQTNDDGEGQTLFGTNEDETDAPRSRLRPDWRDDEWRLEYENAAAQGGTLTEDPLIARVEWGEDGESSGVYVNSTNVIDVTNDGDNGFEFELAIGYDPRPVDSWFNGKIARTLMYDEDEMESDQTDEVEEYLSERYNIDLD